MPDHSMPASPLPKRLVVALGRQRVGKTTLLNATVQFCRALGSHIEVLNADQQNRTHSLSSFFPDAKAVPDGGAADSRVWIEKQIFDMVRGNYHAVLDAGGGATGFSALVEEVPLYESMAAHGVGIVGLVCVGTEQADLDYLNQYLDGGTFRPEATMIVLNAGLIVSGRSAAAAFTPIIEGASVQSACRAGARVVMMPALNCMSEVTDRGIGFADAAEGIVRPGQAPMALFDPVRVREWWTKKMPEFFAKFPPGLLPVDDAVTLQSTSAGAA